MTRLVVGLVGEPNSGVAIATVALQNRGLVRLRFGDAPTAMLCAGLRLTPDQIDGARANEPIPKFGGWCGRALKRTLAFDWGRRNVHSDIWIACWQDAMSAAMGPVVVDDLRMPNEATAIRALGGVIWRIKKPGLVAPDTPTERTRREIVADETIVNDCSHAEFARRVLAVFDRRFKVAA